MVCIFREFLLLYSTTLLSVSSVASITMLNQSLQAINTDFSWRVTNRSKSNNGYLQIEESFVLQNWHNYAQSLLEFSNDYPLISFGKSSYIKLWTFNNQKTVPAIDLQWPTSLWVKTTKNEPNKVHNEYIGSYDDINKSKQSVDLSFWAWEEDYILGMSVKITCASFHNTSFLGYSIFLNGLRFSV